MKSLKFFGDFTIIKEKFKSIENSISGWKSKKIVN